MKRITYLFFLFFLLHYSNQLHSQEISFYYDKIVDKPSSQLDDGQLIENLTRQVWNQTSSSWVNDSLHEYSYNNQNMLDTFITHKWRSGTTWGNEFKAIYNYDVNNQLILKTHWSWGGGWGENSRYYYSYYVNGNLSAINFHSLVEGSWRYLSRTVYTWNEFNLETMIAAEGWWTFYNYWGPFWKEEFSYDSTNSLIMKERFVHYLLGHWEPDLRDLYYYENNGSDKENVRQEWDDTDSIWINDYRYLYEYDINNVLLSIVYQDWQSDSLNWKNVWREAYTYTPQNKIATMSKQTWTQATGWNNYVLQTYFYDANYNWVEKITYLWDETSWKNYYRHLATWIEPVSVSETPTNLENYYISNNYPNPFNPSTHFRFRITEFGIVTLKIYDVLGNEIATLVNEEKPAGEYEVEFNAHGHSGEVRNLPSGIYFYTLRAGAFSETRKMILLK